MPKGVTVDGRWRGKESLSDWLSQQHEAPPCACGCAQRIEIKKAHRHRGVPRFVLGHHARGSGHWNYKAVADWVVEQRGKHLCACGCTRAIHIVARHHATGIPRFRPKHAPPPLLPSGPHHPAYKKDRSAMTPRRSAAFGDLARQVIFHACGGRCASCGNTDTFEFDHIVPVSEGGSGDPSNGQLLCANCHRWKTAITPNYRERRAALMPKEKAHARHR